MRKADEVDWALFTSYILLMSSTQAILADAIDDAMNIGLIGVSDLPAALRQKARAQQLAKIRENYSSVSRRARGVQRGDHNGEGD